MKVAIVDAQGAGIGRTVIKKIRKEINTGVYLIALGTNTVATSNMLKAGANIGVTGEKDICTFCISQQVDCIIGPIGILIGGSINGEITAKISQAIFEMECPKHIIPFQKHGINIAGTKDLQIKDMIEEIIQEIKKQLKS